MVDAPWLSPRENSGAFFYFWGIGIDNWGLLIYSFTIIYPPGSIPYNVIFGKLALSKLAIHV